ncbi:MAG TPA: hypothetical protein VFC00_35400 [Micromonosporaceae bacterium]|nr:hypothetical protein [Micromonosporaceae bacterium]
MRYGGYTERRGLRDITACGAEEEAHGLVARHINEQERAARRLARLEALSGLVVGVGGWGRWSSCWWPRLRYATPGSPSAPSAVRWSTWPRCSNRQCAGWSTG